MTIEEKRSIAIARLDATIEKIKTLKPEQFNYDHFVSEGKNGCGTVCCIIGWYPLWFPETELTWVETTPTEWNRETILLMCPEATIKTDTFQRNSYIIQRLSKYHQLAEPVIRALFFGESLKAKSLDDYVLRSIPWENTTSIDDIISRVELVNSFLKLGTGDHFLTK